MQDKRLGAKTVWLLAGMIAFGLGGIGVVLPILPTVPFFLLAAFCFSRSHPAWADRLYQHPTYGPQMREWRDRRAIPRSAKYAAIGAMSLGVGFTWFTLGWPWVLVSAGLLVTVGPWIWTRAE